MHGDQGIAHDPKLSPPTSLFFCTSAFREKENPEEITFPYRRTLSINGTWGRRGTARTRAVSIPSVLGSRRLCRRHPQVPHAEEGVGGRETLLARAAQHGTAWWGRIPTVWDPVCRFHAATVPFLQAAAFGFMRGVQGVARGSGNSARPEALPTNLPFLLHERLP